MTGEVSLTFHEKREFILNSEESRHVAGSQPKHGLELSNQLAVHLAPPMLDCQRDRDLPVSHSKRLRDAELDTTKDFFNILVGRTDAPWHSSSSCPCRPLDSDHSHDDSAIPVPAARAGSPWHGGGATFEQAAGAGADPAASGSSARAHGITLGALLLAGRASP